MRTRFIHIAAMLLLIAGCGGGGGSDASNPPPPPPPPANNAPQATDLSLTTNESEAISDTLPATDADGHALTFAVAAQPQKGLVSITNASTGAFTYTPGAGEIGPDNFTFTANDGTDTSNAGTVSIDINGVPVVQRVERTISSVNLLPWNGTLAASDPDGDPITYTFIGAPSKGTLSNTDTAAGTFTYTPNAGQSGTDDFSFEVSDGSASSSMEWVIVTFNQPPSVTSAALDVLQDDANTGSLAATDPENDGVAFSIATLPVKGTVNITDPTTGAYTYTSNAGEMGLDGFTFVASDAYSTSVPGAVDVTIHALPSVGFVDSSSYAVEDKIESVALTVSQAIPFDIQVQLQTNGTATQVDDYDFVSSAPLVIPAMSTGAQIDLSVVGDDIDEDETLDLTLTAATNGTVDPGNSTHTLIFDDWRGSQILDAMGLPLPGLALSDMVLDAADNIYVCGWSWISATKRQDVLVEKYDNRGVLQWSTTFAGLNETAGREAEYCTGIAVNSAGDIFVAGTEGYSNSLDGFLVKLDADGNKLWHETMVGFGGQEIRGLALDSAGNVYVVGRTSGSLNGEPYIGGTDALLVKLDSDGNTLWTRLFGSSMFEIAQDVEVGSSGQVYVGGRGRGGMLGETGPGDTDVFLARFTADGTPEWGRVFGSIEFDVMGRLSLDATDNVYITGKAQGLISRPGNTFEGAGDAFFAKFDRDGAEQWIRMRGDTSDEYGLGIVTDTFSNTLASGHWNGNTFFTRYSSSGASDWFKVDSSVGTVQPSGAAIPMSGGEAIVQDSEGNFFVLGRSSGEAALIKLDSTGIIFD